MNLIAGVIAILAVTRVAGFGTSAMAGSISGMVTETGGKGASCLAVSASPGCQSATTDKDGYFTLSGLKAGVYEITVSRGGDMLQRRPGVEVRPGVAARVSFQLPQGTFLEQHSRLLILVCTGVLVILLSVAVKYSLAGPPREESGES